MRDGCLVPIGVVTAVGAGPEVVRLDVDRPVDDGIAADTIDVMADVTPLADRFSASRRR